MGVTQADLDKLEKMIAAGVVRMKFGDREIQYHSMSDLMKARDLLRKQLGKAGSGRKFASYSKGTT